jgi:hypothetical protein
VRQRCLDAEELRFKDEGMACGREEHVARASARDIKREWSGAICEFDTCRVWACFWVRRGPREDGVGDFVACVIRIGYLDMDACICGGAGVCNSVERVRPSEMLSSPLVKGPTGLIHYGQI